VASKEREARPSYPLDGVRNGVYYLPSRSLLRRRPKSSWDFREPCLQSCRVPALVPNIFGLDFRGATVIGPHASVELFPDLILPTNISLSPFIQSAGAAVTQHDLPSRT
jgi:hypothetical protein